MREEERENQMRDERHSGKPQSCRFGVDQLERTAWLPTQAGDSLRTEQEGTGRNECFRSALLKKTEAQGAYMPHDSDGAEGGT